MKIGAEGMDLTPRNSRFFPVDDLIRTKPRIALASLQAPTHIEKYNSPHTAGEDEVFLEKCGSQSPRHHLQPTFASMLPK